MKENTYRFTPDMVLSKLSRTDAKEVIDVKVSEVTPIELPYTADTIAQNLYVPWAIAISDDGKLYVTERSGVIRVVDNGRLQKTPLIKFEDPFVSVGEGGLLGIVLDPNFRENHFLYVYLTYKEENRYYNQVLRLLENNNTATIDKVIVDKIPGGIVHNGGRIKIGPDNKLYITTGDAAEPSLSQDLSSLGGKILRVELDGSIPTDNPNNDSLIYSYGLRNPQGIAWGEDNVMYATDHGSSAKDEINLIVPGSNYGWPLVEGYKELEDIKIQKPLIQSEDVTWAPSGITYINQGPLKGRLMVATLSGRQLLIMTLNEEGTEIIKVESTARKEYGRIREVMEAKDGSIYLTTSNMDGRGFPGDFDDRIIRLIPKEQ